MNNKIKIIEELQKLTSKPEGDWVKNYKNSYEFIYPKKVDIAGFGPELAEVASQKLSECLRRQKILKKEQRKRQKLIQSLPREHQYYWQDLDVNWYSEYFVIQKWIRYWLGIYNKVNGFKRVEDKKSSLTENDFEKARNISISELFEGSLRPSGRLLTGPCPFHNPKGTREKSKSFYVYPVENRFHCFSCGEHGDSIEFIKKTKDFEFIEAIKYLINY